MLQVQERVFSEPKKARIECEDLMSGRTPPRCRDGIGDGELRLGRDGGEGDTFARRCRARDGPLKLSRF